MSPFFPYSLYLEHKMDKAKKKLIVEKSQYIRLHRTALRNEWGTNPAYACLLREDDEF